MPTQLIQVSTPTVLTQNVAYALPSRQCFLEASADVTVSTDVAFGTSRTVTATTGGFVGSGFVKSAGVGTIVIAKPA